MKNSVKILLCIFLLLVLVHGVQAAETYQLVKTWGTYGAGDGQFNGPLGIAVDTSGNVYIAAEWNYRIQKFSSDGTFLNKWGTQGVGDGQFYRPLGVAVDSSGNVYVADTTNNRIQKFSSTGIFLSKWGTYGTGDGQFAQPYGIAVDSSGNVYVGDYDNNRIQKFSSTGMFLGKWGSAGTGEGQFNQTGGIAVDTSGNVYVIDSSNSRIQKFSSTGMFLGKWGSFGSGDRQFNFPRGIAIDTSGNVYVADSQNQRIQKFSSTGTFLGKWRTQELSDNFSIGPYFIAIDTSGNVYVSDYYNNRIQKFAPVQQSLFAVSSITPSIAMNTGAISITDLIGTGFTSGTTVKLTKTGSPDIIASGVTVASPTKISCTFDLTGKGTGQWNVVVTNPDGTSATLLNGFTITTSSQTVDFTGSWTMNGAGINAFGDCWGLNQTGSQVTGGYPLQRGRLVGTVTGETLTGYWSDEPTYAPPKDYGWFTVTLGDNMDGHGYSFDGKWGYTNSTDSYSFRGARSTTVCPVQTVIPITPLSVTAISPSTGTNEQSLSATVTGTGFKPGAVVRLTLKGQPDIVASGVTLTGDSLISCTFDLTGKTTGTWDLAVTNPVDGTTSVRSTAFTLTTHYITNTNGTIVVSSTPQDALVYLDGSLKGTGSITLQDVSPGEHSVRVTKTMYNDYGTDIRVAAGSISYVNAVLTPVSVTSGTIVASSNPAGASVLLDGMDKGISPVTITGISSGAHTVSFTKTGYAPASRTVTMTAGQTMEVSVDLTKTGGGWEDWLNTTTLIIVGIILVIIVIIGVLLRKKKNRWNNY